MGGVFLFRAVVVFVFAALALLVAKVPAQTYSPSASPINAPLDMGFEISQGIVTETDDAAKLPFAAGSVTAHWYQYFGFYVVRYVGLELDTGYCAGNAILSGSELRMETDDPTAAASDCPASWPKAPPPLGAYECGGELVYRTAISTGTAGELRATISKLLPTTGINGAGLTGAVMANLSETPVIDLFACTELTQSTPTPTATATAASTNTPVPTATAATPVTTATPTPTRIAPGPPATGSGVDGDSGALALGAVGLFLVAAGVTVLLIGSRRSR